MNKKEALLATLANMKHSPTDDKGSGDTSSPEDVSPEDSSDGTVAWNTQMAEVQDPPTRPPSANISEQVKGAYDEVLNRPLNIDELVKAPLKRYNLALPSDLFNEVQRIADQNRTSVLEMFRKFIKIGLLIAKLQERGDATFIIRQGGIEKEILIL